MPRKDLVIVVPGIMGTVLKHGDIPVWDTSAATLVRDLRRFADFTERLRLPPGLGDHAPDPPSVLATGGLIGGWHLWPGMWIGGGYHTFVQWLHDRFRPHGRVVEFGYDWRLSNRLTAGRLKEFVRTSLDAWRHDSGQPDAKAVLVCHSMGGLIARHYVNALGDEQTTACIITLGTPFSGSVNAVRSLSGSVRLMPERLVETMLTFPSLRQLLPTFRCVRKPSGMEAIGAAGLPGICSDMIADAVKLRAEGAPRDDGPPLYVFGGKRHSTLAGVESTPAGLEFHHTWLNSRDGRLIDEEPGGDGTVPRFAAIPPEWSGDAGSHFRATRHSRLVNDKELRDRIADIIEPVDPREYLDAEAEFGLDLPDLVRSGRRFPVRALADRSDLRLTIQVADLRGAPVDELSGVPLNPDGEGSYHADLVLPTGVWQIEAVLAGTAATSSGDLVVATDL